MIRKFFTTLLRRILTMIDGNDTNTDTTAAPAAPPRPFDQVKADLATARSQLDDVTSRKSSLAEEFAARKAMLLDEEAKIRAYGQSLLAEAESVIAAAKSEFESLGGELASALKAGESWVEKLF